jgi:parallel beta-helix repeat protein
MLDGQFAGAGNGLTFGDSPNRVIRMAIGNFSGAGVRAEGGETDILGSHIGTDAAGTSAAPNGNGIVIVGGIEHVIGGDTADERNIISGNNGNGVTVEGADGVRIQGNYIGTNASGTQALGNGAHGVWMLNGSASSVGQAPHGNVISGNAQSGVLIVQGGDGESRANRIEANLIGTDASGNQPLGNGGDGVALLGVLHELTIGGFDPAQRNVIAANLGEGVAHRAGGGDAVRIAGNYIGTNVDGSADLGNGRSGVYSEGNNLTIGGTETGAGNVISGNTLHGVHATVRSVRIYGNTIGLGADGMTAFGNGQDGILLNKTQPLSEIGSATGSGRNVISANGRHGIDLVGDVANPESYPSRASIVNNYVGLDSTGMSDRGNGADGIHLTDSNGSGIGGLSGQHNVISGNGSNGVAVINSADNVLWENRIGTDAGGTSAIGNDLAGVAVENGSNNDIGTATGTGHSVISGNAAAGIFLSHATNVRIRNVYLGTDVAGTSAMPNAHGVLIGNGWTGITIGGPGFERNVISGNTGAGVNVVGPNVVSGPGVAVIGNVIGSAADGASPLNGGTNELGVLLGAGASGNTVGSLDPTEGNIISHQEKEGILVSGGTGNTILGNSIHSNGALGIDTINGGNGEPEPPRVLAASPAGAAGTSTCPDCRVSVYSDAAGEGRAYHGTTTADATGAWIFNGSIADPNVTATVEFPGGNTSEFSAPLPVAVDTDGDGCTDAAEGGTEPRSGGDRDPNDGWDFFDVTGDRSIDLADALAILERFGANLGDADYDPALDRYAPDPSKPWRTAAATGTHVGIDLGDALLNLQSFGHDCSPPP